MSEDDLGRAVSVIGLEIAMGVTDTLLHHEFTERLAWRASAERELRLRAVRDWFYSVVFSILSFASRADGLNENHPGPPSSSGERLPGPIA